MENVGSIAYDARIETKHFYSDAAAVEGRAGQVADTVAAKGSTGFRNFASQASSSFGSVADGLARLAKVATGLFIGGAFGVGAFIKQASELQGIRASFESMTGSAEDATKVLQQLNKFSFETAFSAADINNAGRAFLGAGLNVKDLGKTLKAVGDVAGATGADLGQLVLPLSQSLARGKLQTQDYYQILNSGAGKLGQVLRKELAERGMGDFQKAMEEGKITSDILFDTIQKAAGKGGFAFEGAIKQARTFDGQMSNLMETIGNVGLEVLGVNKATGEIDPNGIFAKLSQTVQDATKWLSENKQTIKDVALVLVNNAIPAMAALAVAFGVAKIAAIGFSIAASANPIGIIVIAITALVAALTFLQVKFNIFGKIFAALKPVIDPVVQIFKTLWSTLMDALAPAFEFVSKNAEIFKKIGMVLLIAVLAPLAITIGIVVIAVMALIAIVIVIVKVIGFFINVVNGIIGVIGKFVGIAVGAFQSAWKAASQMVNTIKSVFGTVFNIIASPFKNAINTVMDMFDKMRNHIKNIINFAKTIFSTVGGIAAGALRGAVNGVIGFAQNIINGFIDAINGAIDLINKVPGVNIGKLGKLNIPKLADGGIVQPRPGGVLANIAEAGQAEAVIPLDKLDDIVGGSGDGITINLSLSGIMTRSKSDERELARSLIKTLNEELRAKGVEQIGGGNV